MKYPIRNTLYHQVLQHSSDAGGVKLHRTQLAAAAAAFSIFSRETENGKQYLLLIFPPSVLHIFMGTRKDIFFSFLPGIWIIQEHEANKNHNPRNQLWATILASMKKSKWMQNRWRHCGVFPLRRSFFSTLR